MEELLQLIGDTSGFDSLADFRTGLLSALRRSVPCDYASYNEVGPQPEDLFAIAEPPVPDPLVARFALHAEQHPVLRHQRTTRNGRPTRISDVDDGAFRSSDLYREFYLSLGITAQVAFTLPAREERLVGIALSRCASDFSDAECALLDRARPHLIQAFRTVLEFDELQRGRNAEVGRLVEGPGLPPAVAERLGVTTREGEVLRALALGADTATIAVQLGIAPRTVQKHLENAYAKLGVHTHSAAAATVWAALPD